MRHRVKGKKLSRTAAHRKATMRALAMALIREHRILTTVTKAKVLRGFVEPLITRSKVDTHLNRKEVFSSVQNKETVKLLFGEIAPKVGDRPGGYTRVIKAGFRQGDSAEMAIIELVDFNDSEAEVKAPVKKKTRRAGKANKATAPVVEEENEASTEEVVGEVEESTKEVESKTDSEEKK
tara:strand:- start:190 stop:729 length:540 start_codon:yes stop_codon:yes gene_type:complete